MFNKLTKFQKILVTLIVAVVLFAVSATVSYSLAGNQVLGPSGSSNDGKTASLPTPDATTGESPSDPKTESCPLNGAMHSTKAKQAWEARRPLAVMIENHQEARPQSGLSSADVVYETVAEGGITRFMGIFLCNIGDIQVGPVRSARTYFLDWLSEYDALYAHVGGANTPGPANALGQIIDYKIKDLNQFSIGFPTFWRDYQRLGHSVATEHTMYSTTNKLWDVGSKKGWNAADTAGVRWDAKFVSWKFKDGAASESTQKVTVPFWEGYKDYTVEWTYDKSCNCYKRVNGGTVHNDLNTNQQLGPVSVVVQFETESHANDGYENNAHLLYGTKGQGKALFLMDGKVTEGTWKKANRLARSVYTDAAGKEITFNKGQIWIQTIPDGTKVTY